MSNPKFVTFKLTFESMTPEEVEAERKAADEAFLKGDWNEMQSNSDQYRRVEHIQMPLSAVPYFESDLDEVIRNYHLRECQI